MVIKCAVPTELNQIMNVITPEMNFGATICTEPTALLKNSELTLNTYYTTPKNCQTNAQSQIPYNYSMYYIKAESLTSSFF
jgi:hypothetical protein